MLIYLLLVAISTTIFISHIYVKSEKVNKLSSFIWVLLMTVFVGSQDGMGNDYKNYVNQISTPWVIPAEPFTNLIFYIIRTYDLSINTFFYVYAFLTYYFFSKSILLTNRSSRFLVVIMIFQTGLFFQSFNIIRQVLACSIYLYGILLLNTNNKGWKYLFLACCVHYSAFLGILIFLLSQRIVLNLVVLALFVLSFILLTTGGLIPYFIFLMDRVMLTPYANYLDSEHLLSNQSVGLGIVYLSTAILCFFAYSQRKYFEAKYGNLLTLFFIGAILYNFLSANVTLQRGVYYPYYAINVVIPLWVNTIPYNYRSRIALLIYALFFVSFLNYLKASDCPFVPYKSILSFNL